jgi:hypothetical protein
VGVYGNPRVGLCVCDAAYRPDIWIAVIVATYASYTTYKTYTAHRAEKIYTNCRRQVSMR